MTQRDFTDKLVALLVEASNEPNECIDLDYQAAYDNRGDK